MTIKYPSKDWDENLKRETEADIRNSGEPDKEKVEVVTEEDDNIPVSGLFCVYCHGISTYIYEGMSLCNKCFAEETADLIKKNKRNG